MSESVQTKSEEEKFREILRIVIEYHDRFGDDFIKLAKKIARRFRIPYRVAEKIVEYCSEMDGFFEDCVAENILEETKVA